MKKALLLLLLACAVSGNLSAQRHFDFGLKREYKSDTLRMDGYTYIADTLKNRVVYLFNASNHLGRPELTDKYGGRIEDMRDYIQLTGEHYQQIHDIIIESLSMEQLKSIEGQLLILEIDLCPENGEVTDVFFSFYLVRNQPFCHIPIEVYRNIEVRLKNELQVAITEKGKELDYCWISLSIKPRLPKTNTLPDSPLPRPGDNSLSTEIP